MTTIKYFISNKEFTDYKKKRVARATLKKALRNGHVRKANACELCTCEDSTLSAHHYDYGRPLEVLWLCDHCHGRVHTKTHPLNPVNVKQTANPAIWENQDTIAIGITLPYRNFVALKKISETQKVSISKMIKNLIIQKYPLESQQLEFKFMETLEKVEVK